MAWGGAAGPVELAVTQTKPLPAPGDPQALLDSTGRRIEPLALGTNRAVVVVFVALECPISNSYAPELVRLAEEFGPRGVVFRLIYPDPEATAALVRQHASDYGLSMAALLDPRQMLAIRLGAQVTPEVFLVDRDGVTRYRGRIDDRYPRLGLHRAAAQERNLRDALVDFLDGRPIAKPITRAVGCQLPPAQSLTAPDFP